MNDFRPLDAKALTNTILDWAERDGIGISPMKLQKMVFFPHADFLAQFGLPLVKQEFEAWDYGPVIPSLYHEFKNFGADAITSRARAFNPFSGTTEEPRSADLPEPLQAALISHYDFYKRMTAGTLSDISHSFEGAWRQARAMFSNGLNMDRRISNDLILRFHKPVHI